jgi:hypothetical protein
VVDDTGGEDDHAPAPAVLAGAHDEGAVVLALRVVDVGLDDLRVRVAAELLAPVGAEVERADPVGGNPR